MTEETKQGDFFTGGSSFINVGGGITLGCISAEARECLDEVMAQWEVHRQRLAAMDRDDQSFDCRMSLLMPGHYAFAYWLIRWSGLVVPSAELSTLRTSLQKVTEERDAAKEEADHRAFERDSDLNKFMRFCIDEAKVLTDDLMSFSWRDGFAAILAEQHAAEQKVQKAMEAVVRLTAFAEFVRDHTGDGEPSHLADHVVRGDLLGPSIDCAYGSQCHFIEAQKGK